MKGIALSGFYFTMFLLGCQPALDRQPRINPLTAPLLPPAGTKSYQMSDKNSPEVTEALLRLGQKQYEISCQICHGRTGHGTGLVTQRGFPSPPSFFEAENIQLSSEQIILRISQGHNRMPSFGRLLTDREIWALVHHIKVLQLRENVLAKQLNSEDQKALERSSR